MEAEISEKLALTDPTHLQGNEPWIVQEVCDIIASGMDRILKKSILGNL